MKNKNRRTGDRRIDEGQQTTPKMEVELKRREKDRRLKDDRKNNRMKKELGLQ